MDGFERFCYVSLLSPSSSWANASAVKSVVWRNGDIGLCMEYLIFLTAFNVLFGLVSVLYAGLRHTLSRRARTPIFLLVRALVSFLIAVNSLVEFTGAFWLAKDRPYAVLLSEVVTLISWVIHLVCVLVLCRSVRHSGRGPLALVAAWFLTLVGAAVHLQTVIRWNVHPHSYDYLADQSGRSYFNLFIQITTYVHFGLQCLYAITLVFRADQVTTLDDIKLPRKFGKSLESGVSGVHVQSKETDEERQPLISSRMKEGGGRGSTECHSTRYGAIPLPVLEEMGVYVSDRSKLDADEGRANVISLLTFWWVEPLLRRGDMGLLERPEDLLQLPRALQTARVREHFQRVRRRYGQLEQVELEETSRRHEYDLESEAVSGPVRVIATADVHFEAEADVQPATVAAADVQPATVAAADSATEKDPLLPSSSPTFMGGSPRARSTTDCPGSRHYHKKSRDEVPRNRSSRVSLFSVMNRAFGLHYYPLGVLKLLADILGFAGPLLLHALVAFIENKTEPTVHGYYYALGLFLSTFFTAILNTHFTYQVNKVGLKIRAALITEVYRKALHVSTTTLSKFSTGQVTNFMSTDSDRIVNFCNSFHQFWSLPFQIAVSLYLLHQQVGLAFLAGVGFCVLLVPINRWLAVKIGKLSTEMMERKDERVKGMTEILTGIRVVKFYAWEKTFARRILGVRSLELKSLKWRKYLDALCVYFWATTPVLISILTFTTYVAMGNTLTAAKVFTSVALFSILISPLNAFPWVLNGLVEAWVSAKRVQEFLRLEELDLDRYYLFVAQDRDDRKRRDSPTFGGSVQRKLAAMESDQNVPSVGGNGDLSIGGAVHVSIANGCFSWRREEEEEQGSTTQTGHTSQTGQSTTTREATPADEGVSGIAPGTSASQGMLTQVEAPLDPYESESDASSRVAPTPPLLPMPKGGTLLHSFTRSLKPGKKTPTHPDHPSGTEKTMMSESTLEESATAPGFQWVLSGINLRVERGQLVGVIGRVGAGKTSLLNAITAEMRKKEGEVFVAELAEGFGLAAQEAWIQHATVRENILFGAEFEEDKYRDVVFACALEQDLSILPAGDQTEVGENGVTLSGGQKARLALARAIYQDKAVYLLDDPLAAVDAHVATHIFTHCIMGRLRDKTRILCTHHIRFLYEADKILVMEEGRIASQGPPHLILPQVEHQLTAREEGEGERTEREKESRTENGVDEEEAATGVGSSLSPRRASPRPGPTPPPQTTPAQEVEQVLVKEEEKEVGVVAFGVYRSYWLAVGSCLAPLILTALFLMQASRNINDWWLAYWISHTHSGETSNVTTFNATPSFYLPSSPSSYFDPESDSGSTMPLLPLTSSSDNLVFYLGVYGGLAAANSVFTVLRAFLYAYGGIRAATVLHEKLLRSILRAPVAFFDVTPIGRIVNRFSSDVYAIDDSLPFILNILLAQFYGLLGTIAITCYGLPWFTVLLVPLGFFYYQIQKFYRQTSRELKRLSTVTLSPVYAHFSESLAGLTTIRALRASDRFARENETRLELNQRANFGSYAVAQWLGIRLQMLGVAMVAGVAFIAVLEHHFNSVDPGLVGLAISYALSVTNLLSGMVTSFTETEKQMVSVERAVQYIEETPAERDWGAREPSPNWPSAGVVEFRNVILTYREQHGPALKDVSFVTRAAEKVGVVGRTGAGKSSLFQALFRMVELSQGSVVIDGVDIALLPLERLRSVLAVIPQDPFLFSGSVRDNLDPCGKYSREELWSALERCHLREAVEEQGGLLAEVKERGVSFSLGQRQLVCLARALLTKAKVICIDEATANVDMQTDAQIQQTIRSEFTGSTVITIAHRIETVMSSDRILVMEQGSVRELGTPEQLLDNPDSLFTALFREHCKQMNAHGSD